MVRNRQHCFPQCKCKEKTRRRRRRCRRTRTYVGRSGAGTTTADAASDHVASPIGRATGKARKEAAGVQFPGRRSATHVHQKGHRRQSLPRRPTVPQRRLFARQVQLLCTFGGTLLRDLRHLRRTRPAAPRTGRDGTVVVRCSTGTACARLALSCKLAPLTPFYFPLFSISAATTRTLRRIQL